MEKYTKKEKKKMYRKNEDFVQDFSEILKYHKNCNTSHDEIGDPQIFLHRGACISVFMVLDKNHHKLILWCISNLWWLKHYLIHKNVFECLYGPRNHISLNKPNDKQVEDK